MVKVVEETAGGQPGPGPRVRPTVLGRPGVDVYGRRERLRPRELVRSPDAPAGRVCRVRVTPDGRAHLGGAVVPRSRVFGVERRGLELWLLPARVDLPLLVAIRGEAGRWRLWLTGEARFLAYELGLRMFGRSCDVLVEVRTDGAIVLCAATPVRVRATR
jgi:hypothetical protein